MISIIVPVLNEAAIIGTALENLLAQTGSYEIIIVDGGSVDGTCDVVHQLPVHLVRKPAAVPLGIGNQINLGAREASGHILVFLHVDVTLPSCGLALIQAALADPRIVGGGFVPAFYGPVPKSERVMLRLVERVWRARTRTFRWFAGDTAPFIRADVFQQGGGYPSTCFASDWDFAAHMRKLGRLTVIEEPVHVNSRRHVYNGVLKTLLVTGSLEMMHRIGVDRAVMRDWYHKWLPREREANRR